MKLFKNIILIFIFVVSAVFPIAKISAATATYTFSGVNNTNHGASGNPIAIEHDSDLFPWLTLTDQNDSAYPSNAEYINISADNTAEWISDDPGRNDIIATTFRFFIQQSLANISNIQIKWNGNTSGVSPSNHSIWLRKDGFNEFGGTNTWVQLGSSLSISPNVDTNLIRNLTTGFSTYINGSTGQFEFVVDTSLSSETLNTNYIEVVVTYTIPSDTTPPSAISNLSLSGATNNSINLSWTAPGDDGTTGTASVYDVRYSTSIINDSNWASATQATGEPTPSVAGTSESMTVSGLSPSTLYYFAIKTSDEVPNTSALSNVPSLSTTALADTTPPSAVSNLATSGATTSSINLTWTAPGDDGTSGTATNYDIRYSTATITEGNWASATQATGEPTPSVAGTSESMTVSGLSPSTLYYFAMKTSDEVPNTSTISNVPNLSTTALADTTPPAAVTNLSLSSPSNSAITVNWTAPGDDGTSGTATTYDLRYSTSLITEGNWSSATQVTGEPTPSIAGSSESKIVTGLSPSTLYYFALKTSDEVPNTSALSNVPSLSTTATPDTTPPSAISNLSLSGATNNSINLSWTAPGDDGTTGTASVYDVRYSTSIINDSNWASATQATGEPTPSVAGTSESMTVSGLSPSTLYYFAIKTSDEVPNTSALSNVPSLSTTALADTTPPSAVSNLATSGATTSSINLTWTAPGDDGTSGTATTYDIRYSTATITDGNWSSTTLVTGEPTPSIAGSSESMTVTGLSAGTLYYFAIKTSDEVPNTSALSNVPSLSTSSAADVTPPAAVSDLTASNPGLNSIDLSWTAPGDDGSIGTATIYDIRYSTSNITALNWDLATEFIGEPTPSVAGSSESVNIPNLNSNTTYYFAIKTKDEVPNTSSLSNITNETTLASSISVPTGIVGGVAPTSVIFSGIAYPNSRIIIQSKDSINPIYKNIPLSTHTISKTGEFYVSYAALLTGQYFFALQAQDRNNQKTDILSFSVDFRTDKRLLVENIFLPPTLSFNKNLLKLSEGLTISGYSSPLSKIRLEIDDIIKRETTSDESGYYIFEFKPGDFSKGIHYVRANQIRNEKVSNYTSPRSFKISSLENPKADFNKDDEVNVTDWSVFLYRWGNLKNELRNEIDLDSNGIINISDFSIFLKVITL
ncbi:fibronectin type III domain-containing protein [Patescibacteria group bacterium]|nr:fibronectin type III domain-containing protein [Patescibacteria group bacterium]